MKTRFFLLAAFAAWCFCSCEDKIIEGSSVTMSCAAGSTECANQYVTAGANVSASKVNSTTNVKAVIYATSNVVNEVRITNTNDAIDKVVSLPYNETFNTSDIKMNTEYEYVITWGENDTMSAIHITYTVTTTDGKIAIDCHSSNE